MIKNIVNLGDAAVYCDFGEEVNKNINLNVIKYFRTLKEKKLKGITNLAPSYNKLIITYEEYKNVVEKLALEIEKKYKPTVLVGIMRGAAPFIDILSRIFKLPTAYVVIQSYSGDTVQDKQGELIFARDISAIATNEDFKKVLLVDDLSDTGLTLNKSIEWLKEYEPVKDHIREIKTACLWKKKSSTFTPDFCPILLDNDPWIVQPSEYYDEIDIDGLKKKYSK